jgi:hypothetical protein
MEYLFYRLAISNERLATSNERLAAPNGRLAASSERSEASCDRSETTGQSSAAPQEYLPDIHERLDTFIKFMSAPPERLSNPLESLRT